MQAAAKKRSAKVSAFYGNFTMTLTITEQLDNFVSSYVELGEPDKLVIPYDEEWPSECYVENESGMARNHGNSKERGMVAWRPVRQTETLSFSNVEDAMSLTLDPQYCVFFTRYFSDSLKATAPQGECELLQVWNKDDFERLQQNLIGHLLMKQRLNQAPTLFFGLTDEEDFILTVVNETGEVALEQVGKPAQKILAPSLAHFIADLSPRL